MLEFVPSNNAHSLIMCGRIALRHVKGFVNCEIHCGFYNTITPASGALYFIFCVTELVIRKFSTTRHIFLLYGTVDAG